MRRFEISDRHATADIGLDVEGDSLAELFISAAEGMFAIILGVCEAREGENILPVSITASTREEALVDWLSELIFRFDADKIIPTAYRIRVITGGDAVHFAGEIDWRPFRAGEEEAAHDVKAVTWYKLQIQEEHGTFRCHIVFDL